MLKCMKEFKENKYLVDRIQDDFLKKYAESNLKWYMKKAIIHKWGYYICTLITIICPVISGIVLLIPIEDIYTKLISEVILGISTIAAAMIPLFGYKRKWGMYRNQTENIKAILAEYVSDTSSVDLVLKIEKIKLQTHEKWMQPFNDK